MGASVGRMHELDEPEHGLWTFHQPLSVMGAEIGTRMTVVRLQDGQLLVHSPIRLTTELRARIDALGRVGHVLAPNRDHYLFVRDFENGYPDAVLYAAPGVPEQLPDVRFDVVLAHPQTVNVWNDTVPQLYFRSSPRLQEVVLFHRASRTLITSDLAFNIQHSEGLVSQVMLRLNDSYKSFGPSRVCRSHITDPAMARADVDAILEVGAGRMIMGHGEIVLSGATDQLRRGYRWLS